MLSRRSFAERVALVGIGATAALSLPSLALAGGPDPGKIGTADVIHVEPVHDSNQPIVHDIDFSHYFPDHVSYAAGPLTFSMMPNGDWTFSGILHNGSLYDTMSNSMRTLGVSFPPAGSYCSITIAICVKDSLGRGLVFTDDGTMNWGTPYTFQKSGNEKHIKDYWHYFVQKHSWYGQAAAILTSSPSAPSGGKSALHAVTQGAEIGLKLLEGPFAFL